MTERAARLTGRPGTGSLKPVTTTETAHRARARRNGSPTRLAPNAYEQVLATVDEGVLIIDNQGRLLEANHAASAVLGVDLQSPRSETKWCAHLRAGRTSTGTILDVFRYALRTGSEIRAVDVQFDRDGTNVLLSVNALPLLGEDGTTDGLIVSLRQVTGGEQSSRKLVEMQERLREALVVGGLASWEWQPETNTVLVFQPVPDSTMPAGTVLSLEDWMAMLPSDEQRRSLVEFEAYRQGRQEQSDRRVDYLSPAGVVSLDVRSRAVRDADGQLLCVRGTAQDVTEQELAHRALRDVSDFLQATLDSLSAHVTVLDEDGAIVMTNRAWSEFGAANDGDPGAIAIGANYLAVCDRTAAGAEAAAGLRSIIAGTEPGFTIEYDCHGPTTRRWFQMSATRYVGSGPCRIVVAHENITARKEAERAVLRAHDHLRAMTDSMGEGVFTLDDGGCITYLNQVAQDLLGRPMAECWGSAMHSLFQSCGPDGSPIPVEECRILVALRDKVVARVADDVFIRSDGSALAVSYTVAPFVTDSDDEGCVVVFEDITERKAEQRLIEIDLDKLAWVGRIEKALSEDRFVLHAQPIIELATGRAVQRELLIRMRHPEGADQLGVIPPGFFLPVAEEFGLVTQIDRWVIDRSAELAAAGSPVELNVSARSLSDPRLIDHIEAAIERTGADPQTMIFEITETAMFSDTDAARRFVENLHDLGCKVALDDFGTGYGSFTYIKQLAIDYLKIDIEFVRDLVTNPASRHVVQAIVKLAQSFGLKTTAEGVEDQQTLEHLRELGVDFAQGYYLGRPAEVSSGRIAEEAVGQ